MLVKYVGHFVHQKPSISEPCGAVLVSLKHILTSAHIFHHSKDKNYKRFFFLKKCTYITQPTPTAIIEQFIPFADLHTILAKFGQDCIL